MTHCFGSEQDLDLYLSRELTPEDKTVRQSHLAACPACANLVAQRQAMRDRLRAAVAVTAPAGLEYRIRQGLSKKPRSAWSAWMLIPVSAFALLAAILPYEYSQGRFRLTEESQASYIDRIGSSVPAMVRVGLQQHLHCTVFRKHEEQPPTSPEIIRDLGPKYAELAPVIQRHLPPGFTIMEAHVCTFGPETGRAYTHVMASDGSRMISLLITNRAGGESLENDLRAVATDSGTRIYAASAQRFHIAAFETGAHLVYVVSDLDRQHNTAALRALAPDVARIVQQAEV
jgi:hypothetical protein